MTIAIPGTVIDTRDLSEGGTFIYGAEYSAFPPLQVRQAEARLVDGLMPLSNIMVAHSLLPISGAACGSNVDDRWETRERAWQEAIHEPLMAWCQRRQQCETEIL